MEKKTLIWSIVAILVLIVVAFGVYFSINAPSPKIPGTKFTEDKLITNQTLIDLVVNKHISPLGNNLTKYIVDSDDPEIMDDGWRISYFVCGNNEKAGWIYYSCGECSIKTGLYGPYEWC